MPAPEPFLLFTRKFAELGVALPGQRERRRHLLRRAADDQ